MFGTQLENLAFLHLQHGKREMQSKRHKSIPPSLQPTEGLVAWSGKCAAVIGQWMSLRSHWCLESPTTSYHVGSCRVTLVISTEDCNLRTAQPEANLPVNVGKLAFAIKSLLGHKLVNWLYLLLCVSVNLWVSSYESALFHCGPCPFRWTRGWPREVLTPCLWRRTTALW